MSEDFDMGNFGFLNYVNFVFVLLTLIACIGSYDFVKVDSGLIIPCVIVGILLMALNTYFKTKKIKYLSPQKRESFLMAYIPLNGFFSLLSVFSILPSLYVTGLIGDECSISFEQNFLMLIGTIPSTIIFGLNCFLTDKLWLDSRDSR